MKIKIPRTEEEIIDFTRRTGLIGLSLCVLYILFKMLIFDVVILSEPNHIILFIEIGLVSGFLGLAFAKSKETQS